ncbi:MAG: ferritin-like domain-containing protein [Chloroflexia bacterium]|nr:ferritin-like domain-containing protein [Chloroflexia bacterium]
MRPMHQLVLDAVKETRGQQLTRRDALRGSAKFAAGGAIAASVALSPAMSRLIAAQEEFEDDVDVLNYALTLEHLEATFYEMTDDFELGEDPFGNSINEFIGRIGEHEDAHVETLTAVISDLGGEPVEAAEYDFGVTDAESFIATAAVFENLGVSAYDGAGQFLTDPGLLTAAGTIVAVEARHAAYLNLLIGELPFPDSFETPFTPEEVLEAATPFFVTDGGTPEG